MTTDILIVSYLRDMAYLEYCLKSCWKFATGFNKIVLVVAQEEEASFRGFSQGVTIKTYQRVADSVRWQIQAQAQKCKADQFSEADFVMMVDSDCCWTEPVTPNDYFINGKPYMLYEEYSRLPGCPWQAPTEKAMGRKVDAELMRQHPQVLPRALYPAARAHIEKVHHVAFEDYVLAQKPTFPWFFSEHNFLGAYAYYTPEFQSQIHWINCGIHVRPKNKLMQWWSHSPPGEMQAMPSGGTGKPVDVFAKLGL